MRPALITCDRTSLRRTGLGRCSRSMTASCATEPVSTRAESKATRRRFDGLRSALAAAFRFEVGYAGGTSTVSDGWAVLRRLRAGDLLRGPSIQTYRNALGRYLGSNYVATFGAARMALYCLLKAMRLREDDEVILPGYNCIVIPNAIRF